MTSRDTILGIGSIIGYFSLFVGVLGQGIFLGPVAKIHLPAVVAVVIIMLPWLVVYTITFTSDLFLPPRAFRICLFVAMCWFAAIAIAAEILNYFGYIPPEGWKYAGTLGRVLMHVGWLSLLYIVPRYIAARRFDTKRDSNTGSSRCGRTNHPNNRAAGYTGNGH